MKEKKVTKLNGETSAGNVIPLDNDIVTDTSLLWGFPFTLSCNCSQSILYSERIGEHGLLKEAGHLQVIKKTMHKNKNLIQVIDKIGTYIKDFNCSWLVVKALELANDEKKMSYKRNITKRLFLLLQSDGTVSHFPSSSL
uniref:Uncharacterized protein n=2 Tax=Lactuca sativa TaxID=4236 RepID=A0A9R1V7G8_LACSA|nr:hypothetical protein LSAT_V11C600314120 [Lactuca sativa]